MTRAEWLMAQVDLDPIESHGSMEMSTAKFQSLAGSKRKDLLMSMRSGRGGGNNHRSQAQLAASGQSASQSDSKHGSGSKKTAEPSYESKYTLLDVTESRMRTFVMDQLKRFDCRMTYDSE